MFQDREKLYQIYHTVLTIALTWALVLALNQGYLLRVPFLIVAFYSFTPAMLIYLFDCNKKNAVSYLLLVSVLLIMGLILWSTKTNLIDLVEACIEWCKVYDGSKELLVMQYAHSIVFVSACLGAMLFFLLTRKQLTKAILAVILMVAMIILSVSNIDVSKAVVGICSFYILTVIVELYGMINKRNAGKPEKKEGILYLAPICLLITLMAVALPSKPEPIQWKVAKNAFSSVKEQIESWGTDFDYYWGNRSSEFYVSLTGYSEESGELENNSPLIKDNKIAMKLKGFQKGETVYLMGSVSNIYTGTSWEKSHADYLEGDIDYYLDYIEIIYALSRQDLEVLENNRFLEQKSITVVYNNIKTRTFFYPLKMRRYLMSSKNKMLLNETAQINFVKAQGKGTTYEAIYYEMNLKGEAFGQLLREEDSFTYKEEHSVPLETANYIKSYFPIQNYLSAQKDVTGLLKEDYYEVLSLRADMIEQQYTALPENLPDRVSKLAEEITVDCDTKYDKLKAIEEYLRTNYTYSLEAHKLPKGQDFVDYFLFESKEGYCTSFASAVAVLGRCIGIPTRYVEGFLGKRGNNEEEEKYPVKNSQAHAWAEAYLEGVGWIPLEATPPFYSNRYTEWQDPEGVGTEESTAGSDLGQSDSGEISQPYPSEVEVIAAGKNYMAKAINGVIIFLSAVILFLMVWMIYYYILKYRYWKEYEKADCNRKMYLMFLRILKQLKREGFEREQQETIRMFADRVKDRFRYDQTAFAEVADIFMRYRYAGEEITQEELKQVAIYHRGLVTKEKAEVNRLKVWLEEFIFLTKKGVC